MLLPYAIEYYKNNKEIKLHSSVKKNVLNNVEDNDIYQNFINECLEYTEGEYINKDVLLDSYRIYSHRIETQWQTLLQNLQSRHIKYNCDKKKDKVRGCIENYKFKTFTIDESPLDDGISNNNNNNNNDLIKENEELKNNYNELKKEYDILMSEKKDIETKYNNIIEQYFNKNDIIDNVYIKLQNEILQVKNMFDLKLYDQKIMINKKDNIICDLEKKLKKLKKKFKKNKNLNNDVLKNCISPLDYGIDSMETTESINTFDSTDTFESSFSDEIIVSSNVKIDKELNPIKVKKNKIKKIYPGFENCELEDFLDVPYE